MTFIIIFLIVILVFYFSAIIVATKIRFDMIEESKNNPENKFPCYGCGYHYPEKQMADNCFYADEMIKVRGQW